MTVAGAILFGPWQARYLSDRRSCDTGVECRACNIVIAVAIVIAAAIVVVAAVAIVTVTNTVTVIITISGDDQPPSTGC